MKECMEIARHLVKQRAASRTHRALYFEKVQNAHRWENRQGLLTEWSRLEAFRDECVSRFSRLVPGLEKSGNPCKALVRSPTGLTPLRRNVAHIFHLDRGSLCCCVGGRSAARGGASGSTYHWLPRGGGFSKGGVETGPQGFHSSGQPISRRFDRWSPFWDPRPFLCPTTPSCGPLPLASPCLPHALHLQGPCRPPRARVLAQERVEHQSRAQHSQKRAHAPAPLGAWGRLPGVDDHLVP